MKKQKKAKPKRKQKLQENKHQEGDMKNDWVDDLKWMPSSNHQEVNQQSDAMFSIISWNVLADSYCSYRSHRNLPLKFQRHVFDGNQRQHHVRQALRRFTSCLGGEEPILALQEVDGPLMVMDTLKKLGYAGLESPTSKGGKNGRVDACGLYYPKEHWKLLKEETLRLDDLASLRSSSAVPPSARNNLQGLQTSFLRKNMALLVRLVHKKTNREIVMAVLHLYWNPNYEYVKLCQIHYILQKAKLFCNRDGKENTPFIVCGDFNSQPRSHVHTYLTKGTIDARMTAPWYHYNLQSKSIHHPRTNNTDLSTLAEELSQKVVVTVAPIRYLLDFTLNRFCRWLRILGIDAVLETEAEERKRTKEGSLVIFERCRQEKRTLITTSSRLLLRKDCPPGAYLMDTKSLANLELSLVHLLLSHGVKLAPRKFLTRCVVCNGQIQEVTDKAQMKTIFETHKAPNQINDEVFEVFQCAGCGQGYWWCEKPTSSASRVKTQATNLLEACIRGGVPIEEGDMAMFDFVDVEKVKASWSTSSTVRLLDERLDIVKWLQNEELKNPFGPLTNAYSKENIQFTNVTSDFVGNLDHIMYQKENHVEQIDRLYVPTTFEELNKEGISNGHLLPSDKWPSDHLAIGSRFAFAAFTTTTKTSATNSPSQAKSPTEDPYANLWCLPTNSGAPLPPPLPGNTIKGLDTILSSAHLKIDTPPTPPKTKKVTTSPETVLSIANIQSKSYTIPTLSPSKPIDSNTNPDTVPYSAPTKNNETASSPIKPGPHGERCDCGCVPPIPSLFEMAELRKQHRLKKQREAEALKNGAN